MCGNDDDPTMDLSGDFGPGPQLVALDPHAGRTIPKNLEVAQVESSQDLPSRTAPPVSEPDLS